MDTGMTVEENMRVSSLEKGGIADVRGVQKGWRVVRIGDVWVGSLSILSHLMHAASSGDRPYRVTFRAAEPELEARALNMESLQEFTKRNSRPQGGFMPMVGSGRKNTFSRSSLLFGGVSSPTANFQPGVLLLLRAWRLVPSPNAPKKGWRAARKQLEQKAGVTGKPDPSGGGGEGSYTKDTDRNNDDADNSPDPYIIIRVGSP
eukprot:jgi/Bigna1/74571/fgenesh1_pg.29_\